MIDEYEKWLRNRIRDTQYAIGHCDSKSIMKEKQIEGLAYSNALMQYQDFKRRENNG